MTPLVSIIVPICNVEKYLAACLDSVLDQSFRELEVICVDDGSTDASASILAEYARHDARIRVARQANAGLGAARNRALAIAAGEYVQFLDADDMLVDGALERVVGLALRDGLDHAIFSAESFLDGAEQVVSAERLGQMIHAYQVPRDFAGRVFGGEDAFIKLMGCGAFFVSSCLRLMRRDMLEHSGVRFPEGRLLEDSFFTPLTVLASSRIGFLDERLYRRRLRADSIMTDAALSARRIGDALFVWKRLAEAFAERGDEGDLMAAEARFLGTVFEGFLVHCRATSAGGLLAESARIGLDRAFGGGRRGFLRRLARRLGKVLGT